MILPKSKIKAETISPRVLVVYSKPKSGKTSAVAELPDSLILDLEKGTAFIDACKIEINSIADISAVGQAIIQDGKPYKFIIIDTVTAMEDLVKPLALQEYKSTSMGASFKGSDVLSLPQGAGYHYLRIAFFKVLDYVKTLAPHVILLGHIKDKAINDTGEQVMAANIDLVGKIKSLVCANSDAIAYLHKKKNTVYMNFKTNDEVTCGARSEHLVNQEIIISEMVEGKVKTYWERIYPDVIKA
jgi:hypothetical protein